MKKVPLINFLQYITEVTLNFSEDTDFWITDEFVNLLTA